MTLPTDLHSLKSHLLTQSHYENGPLETPCLIWDGSTNPDGYGQIWWNRANWKIHRLGYAIKYNKLIFTNILHRCDTPACWAEDHLFEGTHKENMQDMIQKGRANLSFKGQTNGRALLNDDAVRSIKKLLKEDKYIQQEIADKFGVSQITISHIKCGRTWGHIS